MKDEEMEQMNNKMTISFNKGVEFFLMKTPKAIL
jgi:hypothetical protein